MVNNFAYVTGGADQNCLALLEGLEKHGHEVAILSTASPDNVVDAGAFVALRVTHLTREDLNGLGRADVARRALWNPEAARSMKRLLQSFKPDVVHAHKLYPQLSVAPVQVAARAGVPIVQTLHDYELLSASQLDHTGGWVDRDESRLSYRVLNTATFPVRRRVHARHVSALIACSRYLAARYRAKRFLDATVLPYFVEAPVGEPAAFSERDGAVFVGRLRQEKGVLDVVRVAEALPALRLKVIGHGPLEQEMGDAAGRLPNLEFLGRRDRSAVARLLATARVSLMPSRWQEPGGIAALEAMSVGTPVVAYRNGGLAEYVSDTGGGQVIEPDPGRLAEETHRLHEDESRWQQHSRRGITGIASRHSAGGYISRLEELYESVALAGRGRVAAYSSSG